MSNTIRSSVDGGQSSKIAVFTIGDNKIPSRDKPLKSDMNRVDELPKRYKEAKLKNIVD